MLLKLKSFGPIDVALLPINGRDAKRYRDNLDAKYGDRMTCIIPKVMEKIEVQAEEYRKQIL